MSSLDFYNKHAFDYFVKTKDVLLSSNISKFLSLISKKRPKILDFGCGSGRDSKEFIEENCDVTAIDGSIEMCKLAQNYINKEVKCVNFLDFESKETFDGIWACASLLHLQRNEIPIVIEKLYQCLNENGILFLSMKKGTFEGFVDERYFTYVTEEEIIEWTKASFDVVDICTSKDKLPGRDDLIWINAFLKKKEII